MWFANLAVMPINFNFSNYKTQNPLSLCLSVSIDRQRKLRMVVDHVILHRPSTHHLIIEHVCIQPHEKIINIKY